MTFKYLGQGVVKQTRNLGKEVSLNLELLMENCLDYDLFHSDTVHSLSGMGHENAPHADINITSCHTILKFS